MTHSHRLFAGALALGLVLAACGEHSGSEAASGSTAAPPTSEVPATSEAVATTAQPATTTEALGTAAATTAEGGSAAGAGDTAAGAAGIAPGTPEAAAAEAYRVVFDSSEPFAAKAAHLEDADTLQPVVEAYGGAGQRLGGIRLEPTAVTVEGAEASVTYDVYFATTRQYDGLSGTVEDRAGTWVVSRAEFCSFMSSARVPCPE